MWVDVEVLSEFIRWFANLFKSLRMSMSGLERTWHKLLNFISVVANVLLIWSDTEKLLKLDNKYVADINSQGNVCLYYHATLCIIAKFYHKGLNYSR